MKFLNLRLIALFVLAFGLSGCANMPDLSSFFKPKTDGPVFKPLGSELAMLAAPASPGQAMTVYCRLAKGQAKFGKTWREFAQLDFILPENDRRNIEMSSAKGGEDLTIQGVFDRAGQKIVFCPFRDVPEDQEIACNSIYALDDDLRMGIKRTFDIPEAVMGGTITCADQELHLVKF